MRKLEAIGLVGMFYKLTVTVDVIIVGGTGIVEFLLAFAGREIFFSTITPGGELSTMGGSVPCLDRISKLVVTRTGTIDLLRFEVRLGTQR